MKKVLKALCICGLAEIVCFVAISAHASSSATISLSNLVISLLLLRMLIFLFLYTFAAILLIGSIKMFGVRRKPD